MHDYMKALQKTFELPLDCEETTEEIHVTCKRLKRHMNPSQKKLLLRLMDLECELRDMNSLNSFFSGYRLAQGISIELNAVPQYSFDAEQEEEAERLYEEARR